MTLATTPPLPTPALQFYEGGQADGSGDGDGAEGSGGGEDLSPPAIYAQLTGFFITGEAEDAYSTSYLEHNWTQTFRMKQFFSTENTVNDSSHQALSEECSGTERQAATPAVLSRAPAPDDMDERKKALTVIKHFLKASIRRRRASRARLVALWRLVSKTSSSKTSSSKRSRSEKRSTSSLKERDSNHRPLAAMENDDDDERLLGSDTLCGGGGGNKENERRPKMMTSNNNRQQHEQQDCCSKPFSSRISPRSVSGMNLPQLYSKKSFFAPRRNSVDKLSRAAAAYSDKLQSPERRASAAAILSPSPKHSGTNRVDSAFVNIISHSQEKEPIPFNQVELHSNLEHLSSYFSSATATSTFSAQQCSSDECASAIAWKPFDMTTDEQEARQDDSHSSMSPYFENSMRNQMLEQEARDDAAAAPANLPCNLLDQHENMIDLL